MTGPTPAHTAENDAPAHRHYWHPVPAYRRVGTESERCACGALFDRGRIIPPGSTAEAAR